LPKKAPEALKSKASGCGRKTEQGWNRVEHFLEQPAVQADFQTACGPKEILRLRCAPLRMTLWCGRLLFRFVLIDDGVVELPRGFGLLL